MTSLFTNLSTVPALTDVESAGCGFPFPTGHIWQPRVWWLIVIVAVPPAGAVDVITSATSAARPSVARRSVLFVGMVPPLDVPLSVGGLSRAAIRATPQSACGFPATPLPADADANLGWSAHPPSTLRRSYAVWWNEGEGPRHAGKLELGPLHALLSGAGSGGAPAPRRGPSLPSPPRAPRSPPPPLRRGHRSRPPRDPQLRFLRPPARRERAEAARARARAPRRAVSLGATNVGSRPPQARRRPPEAILARAPPALAPARAQPSAQLPQPARVPARLPPSARRR